MKVALQLRYTSSADLRAHLFEHDERGALLLPLAELPDGLKQYAPLQLSVLLGEDRRVMEAEILHLLSGSGVVVRLVEVSQVAALVENALIADPAVPPEVTVIPEAGPVTLLSAEAIARPNPRAREAVRKPDVVPEADAVPEADVPDVDPTADGEVARDEAGRAVPRGGPVIPGSTPAAWSFEQLQAGWDGLTMAEKVRVARHGKRPARMMVLKGLDKTLHIHVLNNPTVTPDEVAMMASMASLEPTVLRRIAMSAEHLRHTNVARALITNPKLPLPLVTKLLKHLPRDELSRLTKTGKVRASVKQAIIKVLDRTR
jgi:hypothetical protein